MLLHDKRKCHYMCFRMCCETSIRLYDCEEGRTVYVLVLNPQPRSPPLSSHNCARSSNREPRCAGRMSIEGAAPLLSSSVNPHLCYTFSTSLQRFCTSFSCNRHMTTMSKLFAHSLSRPRASCARPLVSISETATSSMTDMPKLVSRTTSLRFHSPSGARARRCTTRRCSFFTASSRA